MRLTARAAAYLRWQEHPKHPAPRVLAEPGPRAIHVKKLGDLLGFSIIAPTWTHGTHGLSPLPLRLSVAAYTRAASFKFCLFSSFFVSSPVPLTPDTRLQCRLYLPISTWASAATPTTNPVPVIGRERVGIDADLLVAASHKRLPGSRPCGLLMSFNFSYSPIHLDDQSTFHQNFPPGSGPASRNGLKTPG